MSHEHLLIDGSFGEGGGQIIRSSLTLSLVTGRPITIENIRARRSPPGLRRQHLTAVLAAAEVGQAQVSGAEVGASRLTFEPGEVKPGEHGFRIGTAGSATLVLQTVLPAFFQLDGPTVVHVEGGTHNPFAPPFDFLAQSYLPLVNRLGPTVRAELRRYGFFPAGGGRITVSVQPAAEFARLDLLERGRLRDCRIRGLVSNLPRHIAERECRTIAHLSGWGEKCCSIEEVEADGPGNAVLIEMEHEHVSEVVVGVGQKGVKAETVASRAWREARSYLDSGVPVGEHLADQLLLPMGLAARRGQGGGSFFTGPLTEHARTHIEVLRTFLGTPIHVETRGEQTLVHLGGG